MSAFLGGVATGFLQASQRREQAQAEAAKLAAEREERQKDRNLRLGIAERSLEVQKSQLLQSKKNSEKRERIAIANTSYGIVKSAAKANPLVKADILTDIQRKAMDTELGLKPNENGFYDMQQHHTVALHESNEQRVSQLAGNYLSGGADPTSLQLDSPIVKKMMSLSGAKDVKKMLANLKIRYRNAQHLQNLADIKTKNPDTPVIEYKDPATGLDKYKILPKTGGNFEKHGLPGMEGNALLKNEDQATIRNNIKNAHAFKYVKLNGLEEELKNAKDQKNKSLRTALENYIIGKSSIRKIFTSFAEGGQNVHFYGADGKHVVYGLPSIKETFPELTTLFQNKNVSLPKESAQPITKTIDEKVEHVAVALNISKDAARDGLQSGKIDFNTVDLKKRVIDLKVDPNKPPTNKKITMLTVNEGAADAKEVKVNEPIDPKKIKADPKKAVSVDGEETVIVKYKSPVSFNEGEINNLISLDDLVKKSGVGVLNEQQSEDYNRLKEIYPLLDTHLKNPTDIKSLRSLKDKVVQLFNIAKDKGGAVNVDALNSAVKILVEQQLLDNESPDISYTTSAGGAKIRITPSLDSLSEAEKASAPHLRKKQTLNDVDEKLSEVNNNIESFQGNITKIGAVARISQQVGTNQIDPQVAIDLLNKMKSSASLANRPDILQALNTTEKELTGEGFKEGTDRSSQIAAAFQKIQDTFNAVFNQGAARLAQIGSNGFGGLSSRNFKRSGFDSANDNLTIQRLQQVEQWSAEKSKLYGTNMRIANNAAAEAFKNNNFTEAFKQQAIAYENYLLAQNAMTKVTLTYTFAGMVQGESGGRAISNEDFAILYRAIWGGAGGDTARGSFERLTEIIADMKLRNENMLKYVDLKKGDTISRKMYQVERALFRDKYAELYKDSKEFNLLRAENMITTSKSTSQINAPLPTNVITKIDGTNMKDMNGIVQEREAKRFHSIITRTIMPLLPERVASSGTVGTNKVATRGGLKPYSKLDAKTRGAIGNKAVQALTKILYDPGSSIARPNTLRELNRYTDGSNKLGDIVDKFNKIALASSEQEKKKARENIDSTEMIFFNSIVAYVYNLKRPQQQR